MKKFATIPQSLIPFMVVTLGFLLPLFFVPFTSDVFDFNKRLLVIGSSILTFFLWGADAFLHKEARLTRTPWTVAIALFSISTLASLLYASPNRVMATLGNGGLYMSLGLLFLSITSTARKSFSDSLLSILKLSSIVVVILTVIDSFGTSINRLLSLSLGLSVPTTSSFSITGSPLFTLFFLGIMLAITIAQMMSNRKSRASALMIGFSCLLCVGLIGAVVHILPGKSEQPQFLSLLNSWSIATDVLKKPVPALIGVGTDSFKEAFTAFRPVELNTSPLWFAQFNNGRNSIIELLVTQGLFGAFSLLCIFTITVYMATKSPREQLPLIVGALGSILILCFFPPTVIIMTLLVLFLSAWAVDLKVLRRGTVEHSLSFVATIHTGETLVTGKSRFPLSLAHMIGGIAMLGSIILLFKFGQAYVAETWYGRAIIAGNQSDVKTLYEDSVKAITLNPYMETYHRSFALTNLSLAQAIAQKKDATNQEKQNGLVLIQQAIQQSKIALTLNSRDSANWETIATVYQALIGVSKDADMWTIAALQQDIQVDPNNAQLRFTLGNIYRMIGNDEQALHLFEQAAQLKPDYANAYYNMADIYGKKGDLQNQAAMLTQTLQYLPPKSNQYSLVQKALATVDQKLQQKQ